MDAAIAFVLDITIIAAPTEQLRILSSRHSISAELFEQNSLRAKVAAAAANGVNILWLCARLTDDGT